MLLNTVATVEASVWGFVQEVVQFALALASLAIIVWPIWRRQRQKRAEERAAEQAARDAARVEATVKAVDERLVKPLREKVDAIHHTTTVNGGVSNPPTLRDEVSSAVKVASLIAVNLADLSERFDVHEDAGRRYVEKVREILAEHGIDLPTD